MPLALVLSVRFHDGRFHGERGRGVGEWPPAPARLFQALVAGAANGACLAEGDRRALEWLEKLEPPVIAAPVVRKGLPFSNFVPNNDRDAVDGGPKRLNAIRTAKTMRPYIFNADIPLLFVWLFGGGGTDEERARTICEVAERLYQLGRGVDMAWARAEMLDGNKIDARLAEYEGVVHRPNGNGGGTALLCPRQGSLAHLEARFQGRRFASNRVGQSVRRLFSRSPEPRFTPVSYDCQPERHLFEMRPVISDGSFASWPSARAVELVAGLRDKAAARLKEALPEDAARLPQDAARIERVLVGRGATEADKAARVRIVPIPSIGHAHADTAVRRVVVEIPPPCPLRADDIAWAFSGLDESDPATGEILWHLEPGDDTSMLERYGIGATDRDGFRVWRSVTPLALPMARRRRIEPARRADEAKGAVERAAEETRAVAAIRQALRHAGVRAAVAELRVQREPFDRLGERAESFAVGTRFSGHALWHASITFAEPVAGPVLLGDGRFLGLGLMRPDEPMRDVLAFAIVDGLTGDAEPAAVARAARRAMMARVQQTLKRGEALPLYVSGHEPDGRPAGDGVHRHIAVVADLPRRRLLFVAPSRLLRRGVLWRDIEVAHHRRTARALEGMDILRAGRAGRLMLAPAALDAECDPLFAPARLWDSVTDYDVTRHRRRLGDEESLKVDVIAELERCGWPRLPPDAIEVLAARRGPRGGLSGRLRLVFPTAQRGPLSIGRSAHKGGGLFVGRVAA